MYTQSEPGGRRTMWCPSCSKKQYPVEGKRDHRLIGPVTDDKFGPWRVRCLKCGRERVVESIEVGLISSRGVFAPGSPGGNGRGDERRYDVTRKREDRGGSGAVPGGGRGAVRKPDIGSGAERERVVSAPDVVLPPGSGLRTAEELDEMFGETEWLIPGWLPKGHLTLIVGKKAAGKSSLCLTLCNVVARGGMWWHGMEHVKDGSRAVFLGTEDFIRGHKDRVFQWGYSRSGIKFWTDGAGNGMPDIESPQGELVLQQLEAQEDLGLIVVDSLCYATSIDENSSEMSVVMDRLVALAARTEAAVIATHYLRKGKLFEDDEFQVEKIRGHSCIPQPARMIWAIQGPDECGQGKARVEMGRSNLVPRQEPFGFRWTERGLAFGGAPELGGGDGQREKAKELLLELEPDFPMASTTVYERGEAMGLSKETIKRAKRDLGYKSIRDGRHWYYVSGEGDE